MIEHEIRKTYSRREVLTGIGLFLTSLVSNASQSFPEQHSSELKIPPHRQYQYDIDAHIISEMQHMRHINILIHGYGAVQRGGDWVIHPIGESTLRAAALLFQYILTENQHSRITVLIGGSVPYDGKPVSKIYKERLEALINALKVPSERMRIIDNPHAINAKSAGHSTSGELYYAYDVFKSEGFFSFAASPHLPRIRQLARNNGFHTTALSFDGTMNFFGRLHEVERIILQYWFKFEVYELPLKVYISIFDKRGERIERRTSRTRLEHPPPTF